ncbi:MAG TPA: helix-turn-helix transcriptional regulator [Actinomycetota bacterium]|nr:helix-turn-helix transcriptional regulator [Actinomycetota bacterium]
MRYLTEVSGRSVHNGHMETDELERGWRNLSRAERKVVALVQKRLTNPEIAARLYVSPRTVQTHLYNVFKKLGVKSRSELAAVASRVGASDPD